MLDSLLVFTGSCVMRTFDILFTFPLAQHSNNVTILQTATNWFMPYWHEIRLLINSYLFAVHRQMFVQLWTHPSVLSRLDSANSVAIRLAAASDYNYSILLLVLLSATIRIGENFFSRFAFPVEWILFIRTAISPANEKDKKIKKIQLWVPRVLALISWYYCCCWL